MQTMSKRLFIVLAPLVTIAAFVVMPAAAQAAGHWYKGGALVPETEKIPVIAWGELTLSPEPEGAAAVTTCDNAAGGYIENPLGGGAGVGQTQRFTSWACTNAECPPGKITIGGVEFEKEFEVVFPPQDFPWTNEITGAAAPFKLNSTGVVVELECIAKHLTKLAAESKAPPGSGENEQYALAPAVACVTNATHPQDPQGQNGTNLGNNQSKLLFNQPVGSGLSCAGGAIIGKTSQSLKTMGFKGSELITMK
jgi:hypothetical protein